MKKGKLAALLVAAVMLLAIFAGCANTDANGESKDLYIYTYAGYIPDDVIAAFEAETGIRIYYNSFESNEEMLAKLEQNNATEYDLVIAGDYIIRMAADMGLVADFDKSKIPNFKNIDATYQGFFFDEESAYTVPYGSGIPLIVYNPDEVDFEITGYEDLWNPALKDSVAIMANERVVNGITLKTMGESFNTEDLDVIAAAGEKLLELAPNIRIISENETQQHLLSGEVSVAFLYTSQVATALQANPNLKVVYPKEGLGFGIDAAFIPKNAPNSDNAHAFLDYILRGDVSVKIYTQILYMCPNTAAYDLLPEEFQASLRANPDDITDAEIITNVSDAATSLHTDIFAAFRQAAGQ